MRQLAARTLAAMLCPSASKLEHVLHRYYEAKTLLALVHAMNPMKEAYEITKFPKSHEPKAVVKTLLGHVKMF
jgi:hypothetical protein